MKSSDIANPEIKLELDAGLFGLSPENNNNTDSLSAALKFCAENKINRLNVKPGVYHFEITESFVFKDITDFELYAEGARFVFYSPVPNTGQITFFYMENCERVKFTGLAVDWDWEKEPLASLVCAKTVTDEYVDFLCMENREIAPSSLFVSLNSVNPETFTPGTEGGLEYNVDGNCRESFKNRERIGEKLYRCTYKNGSGAKAVFSEGGFYLVRHYMYNGGVFLIYDSKNIIFENFCIYSAPGSGFDVRGRSSYFYFNGVRVTLPEYEARHITTTADAVFLAGTDGHMLFENCDIGFQGDDGINIHNGVYRGIKRIPGEKTAFVLNSRFRKGDKLVFVNTDLTPTGFSAVITDKKPSGNAYKFFLDKKIPEEIGSEHIIYNTSFDSAHFVIRNCKFHENRARGILVQADCGIIENCEFYNIQGAAIQIETGVSSGWCEGRGVRDVVIRNNKMTGCDVNDWGKGVIYMSTYALDGVPIVNSDYPNRTSTVEDACGVVFRTPYPVFKNITIQDNVIEEYPRRAMILTSFDGLVLKNNVFKNDKTRICNNPDRGSVYIAYGKNAEEENNVFKPSPYMLMPMIDNRCAVDNHK